MRIRNDAVVKFFLDLSNKDAIKGITEVETKSDVLAKKFNSAGKALTVGLTTPLIGFGAYAVKTASDFDTASSQIQSSLGLSTDSAKEFDQALRDIYNAGYGESYEDLAQKISYVAQATGEVDPTEIKKLTENAIALQDTFGSDFNETIRGVTNLTTHFGISSEEAFDLFAKGSQTGLDYTDELGDNIAEYGGNFKQAGYSAEEYFQLLANGTKNGAYNLDKVNDSINEVKNRLGDGTIKSNLEMFSSNTQKAFKNWENGKGTMKDVINSIVNDISTCKNEQDQLTMAATAFGTMGEDANLKVVTSLTTVGDEFNNVKGAMDGVKEAKFDNLGSMIESLKRQLGDVALEAGNELMPAIQEIIGGLQSLVTWFKNLDPETKAMIGNIAKVAAVVGPTLIVFGKMVSTISNVANGFGKLKKAFSDGGAGAKLFSTIGKVLFSVLKGDLSVIKLLASGIKALDAVLMANPIALIITAIVAVIAILVTLYTKCEGFRNLVNSVVSAIVGFLQNLWNSIVSIVTTIVTFISGIISTIVSILAVPFDYLKNAFLLIVAILATVLQTIYTVISTAITTILSIIGTIASWIYNNVLLPVFNFFSSVFTAIYNTIASWVNTVFSIFSTIASWIYNNVLSPVFNFFKSIFSSIWGVISGVINKIKSAFNTVANVVKNVFNNVKNFISNIFSTIANIIKAPINGVITIINSVLKAMNKIKVPDWVPGIGGTGINFKMIPKLAVGTNYVAGDGLAYLHEGEAVVPKKYNPAIGGYGNYSQPIYVTVNADMDVNKFGKAFVRDIKTFSGGTKNSYNYGGGK